MNIRATTPRMWESICQLLIQLMLGSQSNTRKLSVTEPEEKSFHNPEMASGKRGGVYTN